MAAEPTIIGRMLDLEGSLPASAEARDAAWDALSRDDRARLWTLRPADPRSIVLGRDDILRWRRSERTARIALPASVARWERLDQEWRARPQAQRADRCA